MSAQAKPFRIDRPGSVLVGDHWPGQGPTLVLLHAGVCDRRSWGEVISRLRDVGVLVSYDRCGFGDSPPSKVPFSHVDDLLAVLDAMADSQVWLVGSSMGGGLALDTALTAPDRIAGLVLLAPGVSGAPQPESLDPATQRLSDAIDAAADRGDLDLVNQLETQAWLDGATAPAGRVGGQARELALAMNAIVVGNGVAEGAGASGIDAWSHLEQVSVPTTVACGALDMPHLRDHAEQLLDRVPKARRADLPGCAHLPYLERPDLVAEIIATAL